MEFLDYILERDDGIRRLVFITDKPWLVKDRFLGKDYEVFIACSRWQLLLHRHKILAVPENNVKLIPFRGLNEVFLKDKILICHNFLETKPFIAFLSWRLRRSIAYSTVSIIKVSKGWFWRISTLAVLLKPNQTPSLGYLPSSDKDLIAIAGRSSNVYGPSYPLLPVLAIVAQYNEVDVINHTIQHLLEQGVDVHVIDNWSTDGSYELVRQIAERHGEHVTYQRFPAKPTNRYQWGKILDEVTKVAFLKRASYRWAMLNDADELRWSPWPGITLQRAFSFIDYLGYNSVDYTLFNFMPTQDGFDGSQNLKKFFGYGEFASESWAFVQIKSWRNLVKANLSSTGGHHVQIPNQSIYPLKFLLGHYSLRSNLQANRKIYKERQPRVTQSDRSKGFNTHYDLITTKDFIRKKNDLIKYGDSRFFEKFLLQRLFGAGIK